MSYPLAPACIPSVSMAPSSALTALLLLMVARASGGLLSPPTMLRSPLTQLTRFQLKQQLVAAAKAKDEKAVLSLVEQLAPLSPTNAPTEGLGSGGSGAACALNGSWRLLFTNARDAEAPARTENRLQARSGRDTVKEGVQVTTGQTIQAADGVCTNFIKLTGKGRPFDELQIRIDMTPLTPNRVRLDFKTGRAFNENAPFGVLRDVSFAFPPAAVGDVFSRLRGKDPRVEPPAYFDVLFIDDSLRVHRTGEGKIFVQERKTTGVGL